MKVDLKTITIIIVLLVLFIVLDFNCPIRTFLSFECPTCGMTSAWLSFFKWNLEDALQCHRMFLLGPIFMVLYYSAFKNERVKNCFLILVALMIILGKYTLINVNNV